MNAYDILKYGNRTLLSALAETPEASRQTRGACGIWSVQDIMAHLASYETMLVEILANLVEQCPTPTLERYVSANNQFNDDQVALRKDMSFQDILAEYEKAHEATLAHIAQIPAHVLQEPGVLFWYGADYSIDDFLVYTYYGHKREHSAQIAAFCDGLKQ